MRRGDRYPRTSGEEGFTFLIVLFALALFGVGLAALGEVTSRERQREKEEELIAVGREVVGAIRHYYFASPGAAKRFPGSFAELVDDKRFAGRMRHLRRRPRDPFTAGDQWGLIEAPDGGMAGIYSRSSERPLRQGRLDLADGTVASAAHYSDWRFVFVPGQPGSDSPWPEGHQRKGLP